MEEVAFDLDLEDKEVQTLIHVLIHVLDIYRILILNGAEGEWCELRQKSKWFRKRSSTCIDWLKQKFCV